MTPTTCGRCSVADRPRTTTSGVRRHPADQPVPASSEPWAPVTPAPPAVPAKPPGPFGDLSMAGIADIAELAAEAWRKITPQDAHDWRRGAVQLLGHLAGFP